jgi:hypothetical protein
MRLTKPEKSAALAASCGCCSAVASRVLGPDVPVRVSIVVT